MDEQNQVDILLPWTQSAWPSWWDFDHTAVLNLGQNFRRELCSARFLSTQLMEAQAQLRAAESQPLAKGGFRLALWLRTLLVLAREPFPQRQTWDEYFSRLGDDSEVWYLTQDQLIPRFGHKPQLYLNPEGLGRLRRLYRAFLRRAWTLPPTTPIRIRLDDLGQLPFCMETLDTLPPQQLSLTSIEVSDVAMIDPEIVDCLRISLPNIRVSERATARPSLSGPYKRGTSINAPEKALCWFPDDRSDEASEKTAQDFRTSIRKAYNRNGSLKLIVCLTEHDGVDLASRFWVLDQLLGVEKYLQAVQFRVLRISERFHFDERLRQAAELTDFVTHQLAVEACGSLKPETLARRASVYAPGCYLTGVTARRIESRLPLASMMSAGPSPALALARFGFDLNLSENAERWIKTEAKVHDDRKQFLVFDGSSLCLQAETLSTFARKTIRYFAKRRSVQSYLKGLRVSSDRDLALGLLDQMVQQGVLRGDVLPSKPTGAKKTKVGFLNVVGVGPGDEKLMSIGAAQALARATELWMQDLGPHNFEKVHVRKRIRPRQVVVNLIGHYEHPEIQRANFYAFVARRVQHLVDQGRRITYVVSGSPDVWVQLTAELKLVAQHQPFDLRLTHSMSFIDLMYSATPLSVPTDFQIRLGRVTDPNISPRLDCVVGQIGDDGRTGQGHARSLASFEAELRRFYPAEHPTFVSGSHLVTGKTKHLRTTVGELLAVLPAFSGHHYSVLLPSLARAELVKDTVKF